tara:strand:- start:518 stop:1393 length:876 start_codon:yes stop_codon:yes gene_type:complete
MNNKNLKTEVTRLTEEEKRFVEHLRDLSRPTIKPEVKVKYVEKTQNDGDLYFILPDAHYPFQDEELMIKVRQCIKDNPPKGVCISGDWLDLLTLGSYSADSLEILRDITLTDEYESGLQGIIDLERVLPDDCDKMFLWGNHEDRFKREMQKRDNGKYGNELQNPTKALRLEELGWEVKEDWRDDFFTIGDLDVMHGVYCCIHTAKKHLEMHGNNIMFGHTHRIQTYFTRHLAGFNIGCLADINHKAFSYMPRMQREVWSQGFGVTRVRDGKAYSEVIPVRSGGFFFNGKQY